jgi:hypothetical protein
MTGCQSQLLDMLSRLLVVASRLSILAVLLTGQDALPQQIEFRTTVHTAFTEVFLFGPNLLCCQACRGN